jgi:hypothetical protein
MRFRRRADAIALFGLLALAPLPAAAKPEWAKPFLDMPTPAGPYIAKNDVWAVVYGEVEFALTETKAIEARYHLLLENLSDRPESFTLVLYDDELEHDMHDPALYAQRTIWHRIDVTKKSANLNMKGGVRMLYTSVESLEPHKRVVMEYALVDKLGYFAWAGAVPREEPMAKVRYSVEPASARSGLVLDLRAPEGGPLPPGFVREADGSFTVTSVPAWKRIAGKDLIYQPESHELYPYFVVRNADSTEQSLAGFTKRYRTEWNRRVASIDARQVKARAEALIAGAASVSEKAARLSAFVQREVQYDDTNEQSLEAWMPLSAAETLRSLKADCKGKVMLLQALLRAIDLESAPVLLHVGHAFSDPTQWAGNFQFNHVILAVSLPRDPACVAVLEEGPGKGMLLVDPTWSAGPFGAPLPGYEGTRALFVGEAADPLFTIRTTVPSSASTSLRVDVRLTDTGFAGITVAGSDGGASPLLGGLLGGGTAAHHKELAQATLDEILPGAEIQKLEVSAAPVYPPAPPRFELQIIAPHALQLMETSALLPSPFGLAAAICGLPQSLRPAAPARADDAVTLVAPWDAKRNTFGPSIVVDATVTLALPPTLTWTPPAAKREERPWVRASLTWASGDQPNTYEGKLHLELPHGSWPSEERKTRLKVMDDLFTTLSGPILLKRAPAAR